MADSSTCPWDRRPGEPPKQYAAFEAYLRLGRSRSLRKLADEPNRPGSWGSISAWSSAFGWAERAEAWDGEERRADYVARLVDEREVRRLKTELGELLLRLAFDAFRMIRPGDLSVRDTIALFRLGVKLQRDALALPEPETIAPPRARSDDTLVDVDPGVWRKVVQHDPHVADAVARIEDAIAVARGERHVAHEGVAV